jgi:hypothetical protein
LFKFYSRSKTTTITNFILDEIKRSISICLLRMKTVNKKWLSFRENIWNLNEKCVFNVNFQYIHKQVPTAYFSMMFNIHKQISHLIFVLVPECGEYVHWNDMYVTVIYWIWTICILPGAMPQIIYVDYLTAMVECRSVLIERIECLNIWFVKLIL